MFSNTSNLNYGVDMAFAIIMGISLFFLLGVMSIMIYFIVRYSRKRHPKAVQIKDNVPLEITWTIIPVVVVIFMFWIGYKGFLPMRSMPKDAININVIARKWDWTFTYPNGKESPELFVPINKAVKLNMQSIDVIHSLYIPAFRIKEDVVPGYTSYMWFIAQQDGDFDIYCAEYCGLNHAFMGSKVRVMDADSFDRWLAVLPPKPDSSIAEGLALVKNNGCTGCHSVDGSKLLGPSFKGLFNSKKIVSDNNKEFEIIADEKYIMEAIVDPNKTIVKGFNKGLMMSYKDKLSDQDIQKITDYLKTLVEQ